MPRKKKSKVYFTLDTEHAIIEYNKTKDQKLEINYIKKEFSILLKN